METQQSTKGAGLATAGLVLSIVGAVLGLVPLTGFIALICGVLALVFGICSRNSIRPGFAKTGMILGVIAIALGSWGLYIVGDAVNDLDRELEEISDSFDDSFEPVPYEYTP